MTLQKLNELQKKIEEKDKQFADSIAKIKRIREEEVEAEAPENLGLKK